MDRFSGLSLSIELLSAGEIERGLIADHWRVRGTNTSPARDGSEPTGRSMSFKGASIICVEGDKIRSDHAYFDRKTIEEVSATDAAQFRAFHNSLQQQSFCAINRLENLVLVFRQLQNCSNVPTDRRRASSSSAVVRLYRPHMGNNNNKFFGFWQCTTTPARKISPAPFKETLYETA